MTIPTDKQKVVIIDFIRVGFFRLFMNLYLINKSDNSIIGPTYINYIKLDLLL